MGMLDVACRTTGYLGSASPADSATEQYHNASYTRFHVVARCIYRGSSQDSDLSHWNDPYLSGTADSKHASSGRVHCPTFVDYTEVRSISEATARLYFWFSSFFRDLANNHLRHVSPTSSRTPFGVGADEAPPSRLPIYPKNRGLGPEVRLGGVGPGPIEVGSDDSSGLFGNKLRHWRMERTMRRAAGKRLKIRGRNRRTNTTSSLPDADPFQGMTFSCVLARSEETDV